MKHTLIKITLAALTAAALSACDFGGGDEENPAELHIQSVTDGSFGKGGFVTPDLAAYLANGEQVRSIRVNGLLTDSRQRVVAVGAADTTSGRHLEYLARFSAGGVPDATCAGTGVGIIAEAAGFGNGEPVEVRAVEALGRYIVRGSKRDRNFTAVNEDCTVASDVGDGGHFWASGLSDLRAMALMGSFDVAADGTIVATSGEIVVRFTPSGQVDRAFGTDGLAMPTFGNGSQIEHVRLRADGRVVLAGQTALDSGVNTPHRRHMGELDVTGRVNTTFGQNGFVSAPASTDGTLDSPGGLVLLSDGAALLAWSNQQESERAHLFKVDSRGAPASGFGQAGAVSSSYRGNHTEVTQLSTNGRNVVMCGAINPDMIIAPHRIAAYVVRADSVGGSVDGWGTFNNPWRTTHAAAGGEISLEKAADGRFHECRGLATASNTTFVSLTGFDGRDLIARVTR